MPAATSGFCFFLSQGAQHLCVNRQGRLEQTPEIPWYVCWLHCVPEVQVMETPSPEWWIWKVTSHGHIWDTGTPHPEQIGAVIVQ